MGRLLEGKWITTDLGPDAQGNYVRRATQFRHAVVTAVDNNNNKDDKDDNNKFPVQAGRYRLIVGAACGWSHRTLLVRALLGLQDVIPVTLSEPFMGEQGWTFADHVLTAEQLYLDPTKRQEQADLKIRALHQLYTLAQPDYTGRASVPVLWDMQTGTIVNNESSDLVQMFLHEFATLVVSSDDDNNTTNGSIAVDLWPQEQKDEIQQMINDNYGPVNNGVYKCGFAGSQQAYDDAAQALFQRLSYLEELLGQQRYLMGNHVTLADLCLFPTLYRFDEVYYTHFKCNQRHLYEMPNLWGWARDIYQLPGVQDTCDMKAIKEHYYTSHESIHPRRYIPVGPNVDWDAPHGRDNLNNNKIE